MSRSVQRRIAIQKGEEMPVFDTPPTPDPRSAGLTAALEPNHRLVDALEFAHTLALKGQHHTAPHWRQCEFFPCNSFDAILAAARPDPTGRPFLWHPCLGKDQTCPCQDGDPCHYIDYGDGIKPMARPAPTALVEVARIMQRHTHQGAWAMSRYAGPNTEQDCLLCRALVAAGVLTLDDIGSGTRAALAAQPPAPAPSALVEALGSWAQDWNDPAMDAYDAAQPPAPAEVERCGCGHEWSMHAELGCSFPLSAFLSCECLNQPPAPPEPPPAAAALADYEAMRMQRGWPTPNHMRRTADALDALTPARYGDVLRWFADLCDAALADRGTEP